MDKKPTYKDLEDKIFKLELENKSLNTKLESKSFDKNFILKLFDTIPNPVFYKDIDGIYQNCNDAFTKTILGISKEMII